MIAFVEGELVEKTPARAVLKAGGIGYEIFIPLSSFDRLPPVGGACRLLTYDYVREDARLLYGFVTEMERDLFTRLVGVSGIGPKTALSALGGLSPSDLVAAVANGDIKRLSSISGIGKKTAERIVVELRDKLSEGEKLEAAAGGAGPKTNADHIRRRDAILALVSLGYKMPDASKMIQSVADGAPGLSVEDLVRRALASR